MLLESFSKLKGNLELSPSYQGLISTHHKAVRSVIERSSSRVDTRLIGSLQRNTRIPPRDNDVFDIDILVELGAFTGWISNGVTARDALAQLGSILGRSERYGSMSPYADAPTICFHYKDNVKVELVPAYRDDVGQSFDGSLCPPVGRGYWVPSQSGDWMHADYDYDAERITEMNRLSSNWLIPTIKMLKVIKRQFFPQLSSFHLEILAWRCVPVAVLACMKSKITITFPALLARFFQSAQTLLSLPLKLNGSNSPSVSLGIDDNSRTSHVFRSLASYCTDLISAPKESQELNGWRELFGDLLPLR